jgi:hypothetical protein
VTITKGLRELDEAPLPAGRVRRVGAGRLPIEVSDPELAERLDALVEPLSRGDPDSPLRWTTKGTRMLAAELTADGHPITHQTVAQVLRHLNCSLRISDNVIVDRRDMSACQRAQDDLHFTRRPGGASRPAANVCYSTCAPLAARQAL